MAKPPLPIVPFPQDAPEWFHGLWANILLDWQFDYATSAGRITAKAFNSAVQNIPNAAATALTFDTDSFDIGALHSTTVNNSRFTVPVGQNGLYLATGQVEFAANAVGARSASIFVNGNPLAKSDTNALGAGTTTVYIAMLMLRVGGDFIEFDATQTSGAGLNTVAGSTHSFGVVARVW